MSDMSPAGLTLEFTLSNTLSEPDRPGDPPQWACPQGEYRRHHLRQCGQVRRSSRSYDLFEHRL